MNVPPDAAPLLVLGAKQGRGQVAERLLRFAELTCLFVEIQENFDLGAKDFGNDRDRYVIHCSELIPPHVVFIRQVYSRYKNDGGLLKPRVPANRIGQLKPIHYR